MKGIEEFGEFVGIGGIGGIEGIEEFVGVEGIEEIEMYEELKITSTLILKHFYPNCLPQPVG